MIRRRAFVVLPLVLLLGLSAAALAIIYGLNAPPKQTTSAVYNNGNKWGPTFGLPIVALYFVWQAGRWAEKRGTGSANAVFGGILALFNLALGVNAYRVTLGKSNAAPPLVARAAPPPAPLAPPTSSSIPPQDWTSRPGTPQARQPERAPSVTPPPVPAGPSEAEIAREQADAKATPIIEAYRSKLLDEATAAAGAAEGFAADIGKPPAHDKRVLKERTANADALRNALVRVEARLKAVSDDLEKELAAGGMEAFDARHRAVRFSAEFNAASREFAASRLIRLCDRVKSECERLDREFAAWTLTKGEIVVKDAKKRHELTTERFFIEAETQHLRETLGQLREGR